jgi:uncharacterized membrane protein YdbT with pleckstrin-like domain
LSIAFAWLTGGLVNAIGAVGIEAALSPLIFPFDFVVGWSTAPYSILVQLFIFLGILLFEARGFYSS